MDIYVQMTSTLENYCWQYNLYIASLAPDAPLTGAGLGGGMQGRPAHQVDLVDAVAGLGAGSDVV